MDIKKNTSELETIKIIDKICSGHCLDSGSRDSLTNSYLGTHLTFREFGSA